MAAFLAAFLAAFDFEAADSIEVDALDLESAVVVASASVVDLESAVDAVDAAGVDSDAVRINAIAIASDDAVANAFDAVEAVVATGIVEASDESDESDAKTASSSSSWSSVTAGMRAVMGPSLVLAVVCRRPISSSRRIRCVISSSPMAHEASADGVRDL